MGRRDRPRSGDWVNRDWYSLRAPLASAVAMCPKRCRDVPELCGGGVYARQRCGREWNVCSTAHNCSLLPASRPLRRQRRVCVAGNIWEIDFGRHPTPPGMCWKRGAGGGVGWGLEPKILCTKNGPNPYFLV